jgi:hypothetical protein
MAAFMLSSVTTTVNSVDYSQYLKSATLTVDAAVLDTTDFASVGWTEAIGGLKSGTLALEFNDDVTVTTVDDRLFALLGTVVAFTIKPTSSATSTSNPVYSGSVLITGHSLGGAVGDLAGKSLSFPTSGAVTRATA